MSQQKIQLLHDFDKKNKTDQLNSIYLVKKNNPKYVYGVSSSHYIFDDFYYALTSNIQDFFSSPEELVANALHIIPTPFQKFGCVVNGKLIGCVEQYFSAYQLDVLIIGVLNSYTTVSSFFSLKSVSDFLSQKNKEDNSFQYEIEVVSICDSLSDSHANMN